MCVWETGEKRERVRLLYIKVKLFPTASIMLHKWCTICQTAAGEKLLHTCLYAHTRSHRPTSSPDFCCYSKQISLLIESLIHTYAFHLTLDVTQTSLRTLTATFPQSSSPFQHSCHMSEHTAAIPAVQLSICNTRTKQHTTYTSH